MNHPATSEHRPLDVFEAMRSWRGADAVGRILCCMGPGADLRARESRVDYDRPHMMTIRSDSELTYREKVQVALAVEAVIMTPTKQVKSDHVGG